MKEKIKKLKPKDIEFAKKYVANNENGTKTVKEVYGTEDDGYARVKATRLITQDNVSQAIEVERESLLSALEKEGVTPKKISKKINVLLEASKEVYETNDDGEREQVGKLPDFTAIDKGLKHATAIYGITDPQEKKTSNTYNFLFSSEVQGEVKKINDVIKAKLIEHVQEDN